MVSTRIGNMRKRFLLTIILVLACLVPASAKDRIYKACTADGKPAELSATLNDGALKTHPEIDEHVAAAFTYAAKVLSADDLVSGDGYFIFVSQLSDDDKSA